MIRGKSSFSLPGTDKVLVENVIQSEVFYFKKWAEISENKNDVRILGPYRKSELIRIFSLKQRRLEFCSQSESHICQASAQIELFHSCVCED